MNVMPDSRMIPLYQTQFGMRDLTKLAFATTDDSEVNMA